VSLPPSGPGGHAWPMEHGRRWSPVLAGALVLPAIAFVAANLLKYGFGVDALSDTLGPFAEPGEGPMNVVVTALVILGPVIAAAIALVPILRLRLGRSDGTVEAVVSLRLEWARVAIALIALAVLAVLAGYVAAENSACWLGSARAC
jgi:heme/copper-type cytochrome/quinol oxidase subunit 2